MPGLVEVLCALVCWLGVDFVLLLRDSPCLGTGLMEGSARPDYKACVAISTKSSLSEMIPPGALVMLTPVIVGALFGTQVRLQRPFGSLPCGSRSHKGLLQKLSDVLASARHEIPVLVASG
jgi:hypothetical protein